MGSILASGAVATDMSNSDEKTGEYIVWSYAVSGVMPMMLCSNDL